MNKSSKINKIGVEIEGGWKKDRAVIVNNEIYNDSSVDISGYSTYYEDDYEKEQLDKISGEISSEPYTSLTQLERWMRASYPDNTNETCGLHVHVSTKSNLDYALLMHRRFFRFFMQGMEEWGKHSLGTRSAEDKYFWNRLKGKNHFCKPEWKPLYQLEDRESKYTALNYGAFRDHGTVECRLLPAFKTVEKSVNGVKFVVKLVDGYLQKAVPNDFTKKYLKAIEKGV